MSDETNVDPVLAGVIKDHPEAYAYVWGERATIPTLCVAKLMRDLVMATRAAEDATDILRAREALADPVRIPLSEIRAIVDGETTT